MPNYRNEVSKYQKQYHQLKNMMLYTIQFGRLLGHGRIKSSKMQAEKEAKQKFKLILNVPIQVTNLETPEGESYISQRIRSNSPVPLPHRHLLF
jgi:hypothetical protein